MEPGCSPFASGSIGRGRNGTSGRQLDDVGLVASFSYAVSGRMGNEQTTRAAFGRLTQLIEDGDSPGWLAGAVLLDRLSKRQDSQERHRGKRERWPTPFSLVRRAFSLGFARPRLSAPLTSSPSRRH